MRSASACSRCVGEAADDMEQRVRVHEKYRCSVIVVEEAPIAEVDKYAMPGKNGEVQLTYAPQTQVASGKVIAYCFQGRRFDCGSICGSDPLFFRTAAARALNQRRNSGNRLGFAPRPA